MTGAVGQLTPTTFPKGMVPLPKGAAGRLVRSAGQAVQIMKGSRHHDAAWQFVRFSTSTEGEKIMYGLRVSLAWHKASLGSPEYARLLHPWESAAAYAECVNKGKPTRFPGEFTAINRLYQTAYDEVRHGRKSARQAMTEIKPEVNALLVKGRS
ncbi:MAG: extracellular solute-binding protein [Chloroflexi bacterium]|nr:extracellular solute-binding protein [Chloroflexota bacterium]